MVDGDSSGEPSCIQTLTATTQVEVPSLMINRWTVAFLMETGIWNTTDEGRGGFSDLSEWKKIIWLSWGSMEPKVDNRTFRWDGNVWRTSSVDMAVGDCTKSSIMLYVWATLAKASLQPNRHLILGITSNFSWGVYKVFLGDDRGSMKTLGWDLVTEFANGLLYWRNQVWRLTLSVLTSLEFIIRIW